MTTVPFRSKQSAASVIRRVLHQDEHAPYAAMIEIADRCNEVCVHCYQIQGQKGEMSTADVLRVIDELAEMGVMFLTISGGEPTLRHDFLEIVAHARKHRFAVKVFTNGLNMTRELAQRLADLAVQEVQISLYSHRAEVHDWVTGVPGAFDKTVQGVRHLREAGVALVLKSPLMSVNADEYPEYIAFVQSFGADYMLDPHLDPRENGDRSSQAVSIDHDTLLRVRKDERLSGPAPERDPERPLEGSVCGACSGNIHIEANGEMRPCTQLTVPVGNAVTDGVREAWQNNQQGQAIRALTWRDLHGCRECDLMHYCSRCFANAQMEGGDALGPYVSACRRAHTQYELVHGVAPNIQPGRPASPDPASSDPASSDPASSDPASSDHGTDLGPYRQTAKGQFETVADRRTGDDDALAARYPWIRQPASAASEQPAQRGQLVQIRRPGKSRVRLESIPS